MRLFTSGPKPLARISEKVVCQSLSSPWRRAVAQAVEAGQVGGGLAHGNDVVGGQSIAGMGQADLLPGCSQDLQGVNAIPDRLFHLFVHSLAEVLLGNADLQAADAVFQARQIAALLSAEVESRQSCPDMTSMSRAVSSTVWVSGPICSRELA